MLVTWISSTGVKWGVSTVCLPVSHSDTITSCHNLLQTYITPSRVPLQLFQWYWHMMLLMYLSMNRCRTHWEQTLWYPRSCMIACTVQMLIFKSIHRALTIWCQSLPTAFFNHVKFSGLATVWTCPHLDMSAVLCLPISNIHSQSTTVVFAMHVHHRQHTSTYEFHQVVILPLWETKFGQIQHLAHHLEEAS
jgi:hypothetical protein